MNPYNQEKVAIVRLGETSKKVCNIFKYKFIKNEIYYYCDQYIYI